MMSWLVFLGLIRSKGILPQRVTSPGYHAVFASPPAEQESGIAHLELKYVSTTVPNFLKHPRKSTNSSFLWTLA